MTLRRLSSLAAVLILGAALLPASTASAAPVTWVVNVNDDSTDFDVCSQPPAGDCSIREALLQANQHPGLDKITFALGAGVPTINVAAELPEVDDRVSINGNTGGATRVEITGPPGEDAFNGLLLSGAASSGSVIRKLVINGFGSATEGAAIAMLTSNDNVITGNWIGTDETGLASGGPGAGVGIAVILSSGTTIGGDTAGLRNVISDNGLGILVEGNMTDGNNVIEGNYIGTNRLGTAPLGNGEGIEIEESHDDRIQSNLVSGNGGDAIRLEYGTVNATVINNDIGLDVNGGPLSNGGTGVVVADDLLAPTAAPTNDNAILGNQIANNGALGIDLGDDGVTPNDNGDPDDGPNGLQNFAVITRADNTGAVTFIRGRVRTLPNRDVFVELFASPACDPSGFGEGQEQISSVVVHTDAEGRATFADNYPARPVGWVITATATLDLTGPTSEFSACETVI